MLKHIGNRTPVMIITCASDVNENSMKLWEMGYKEIVPKPFQTKKIFELIEKHSAQK